MVSKKKWVLTSNQNHATMAGNNFEHEIEMANAFGIFGSIDFNRGDPQKWLGYGSR